MPVLRGAAGRNRFCAARRSRLCAVPLGAAPRATLSASRVRPETNPGMATCPAASKTSAAAMVAGGEPAATALILPS